MKKFDFRFIGKDNVYVGNIMIVKKIDKEADYKYEIAKNDAVLIRVSDRYFVDLDAINCIKDCEYINDLLERHINDTNILMTHGTSNPYVGQLYVIKLKKYPDLNKKRTDVMELKLLNAQK